MHALAVAAHFDRGTAILIDLFLEAFIQGDDSLTAELMGAVAIRNSFIACTQFEK